jgi:hypothetical protein
MRRTALRRLKPTNPCLRNRFLNIAGAIFEIIVPSAVANSNGKPFKRKACFDWKRADAASAKIMRPETVNVAETLAPKNAQTHLDTGTLAADIVRTPSW